MTNRTKQIITGISLNILWIIPIYFGFFNEKTKDNFIFLILSFLPCILAVVIFRYIWGPKAFREATWEKKGFKSFSDWLKKSDDLNARLFRANIKIILPVILLFSILSGILIGIF